MTADNYATSANVTSITLIMDITETSYYIKNFQSLIVKQAEIIFRVLLFSILYLEISALAFVIIKLLLISLYNKVADAYRRKKAYPDEPVQVMTPPFLCKRVFSCLFFVLCSVLNV
jgi:hypothetical protein